MAEPILKINGYNTFIIPGAVVFYPTWNQIIIPCVVEETEDVFSHPNLKEGSIWRYTSKNGDCRIAVPTSEIDEFGWPVWRKGSSDDLIGAKQCSQFLWLDEPVGHSVLLGDDCFLTLFEARKHVRPTNKKHLVPRLIEYRRYTENFISSTWKNGAEKHSGFDKMPLKKVYVRRA